MPVSPLNKIQQTFVPGFAPWREWAREQYGYRASGIDRRLPQRYELLEGRIIDYQRFISDGSLSPGPDPCSVSAHTMRPFSDDWTPLLNAGYEKFKAKAIGEESQLGTTFAEWKDSLGMITNRATTLYGAYRELRRGNFRRFLNQLRTRPKGRHRSKIRNTGDEVSGLWLEYHFGWSPLLGDIYGACQVMSDPVPSGFPQKVVIKKAGIDKRNDQEVTWRAVCSVGGGVVITNPNLALASRLGLINPAQVAWELIPFSFVADWAFDISLFIGSFSDFAGMDVIGGWHSGVLKSTWKVFPSGGLTGVYKARQAFMTRRQGLPRPLPNWNVLANLGDSPKRAATALSLFIQALNGGGE